ncbi:glycerol kinase [Alteromonas aestuariivivens]|uniref:Glycerol kinase n=1 Tax=Alteromonas aestuariivivens TaxID=1938339 RepID=A0A3D8ME55_9ALTE|nr:glycerol kinase GlpK [Alteromonas aestuariivivens]RDV29022.1 glycerol kinase [Alteromonas aestuariivivens]
MDKYILAIDQGTTSSRAIIFAADGTIKSIAQQEFPQHYPQEGWVEHDAGEIWSSVLTTLRDVFNESGLTPADIATAGITNQRETTLVWDRNTGEPIYPAIVWQDRRTSARCKSISQDNELTSYITEATGLLVDPYFSATKIQWILDEVDGARDKAERGELLFGTIDTFLIWRLTKGQSHKTDATNASRTMLFDIHRQQWDERLLKAFNIPAAMLPTVEDSAAEFGSIDAEWLGHPIPIQGVAGDQQAALVGQACFEKGMAKSTYGTGCFMMLNTGETPLKSSHRLLTTVAYRINGKTHYALEGSIFMAGATVQWLRDGLKLLSSASESEALAKSARQDSGVFLVPAFTGLGAPYWDPDARGAIFGLTRDTGINELVAAGLQSVCYQTKDLQKAMESDGARPTTLRVDGGMSNNDWVMGFLADILGAEVERPKVTETTALGAAYLAGHQAGIYVSVDQVTRQWQCETRFKPRLSKGERDQAYARWRDAVDRTLSRLTRPG